MGENGVWEHPPYPGSVRNEEKNKNFFKYIQMNGMLHPIFKKTQPVMMRRWKMISGRSQGNSFIVITLYQESNCTCPKEQSFPISLKYIDVTRTTHTSQDVFLQKHIEDYWNVDCERKSSDAWTGFTRFNLLKWKATRRVHLVREETCKETKNFSSWWCVARFVEVYVWCSEKESKTKMEYRETKDRQCQTIEWNILHRTSWWRVQAHHERRWEEVSSSDASSNALQNTDKEQWRDPPQYLETHDKSTTVLSMPTKARDQG